MPPPKSELFCCGCACCVKPNNDGVEVAWPCCVLVLPNRDGVVVFCCVDVPLKVGVSLL